MPIKVVKALFFTILVGALGCGGYDNTVSGPTLDEDPTLSPEAVEETTMGDGATRDPTMPGN